MLSNTGSKYNTFKMGKSLELLQSNLLEVALPANRPRTGDYKMPSVHMKKADNVIATSLNVEHLKPN